MDPRGKDMVIRRVARKLMCGVTRLCTAGLVLGFVGPVVHAQIPADNFVHWGYASYFGTGWYSVGNELDVFAVRAAPRWNWGEPGLDGEGNREIGIELRLPVTFSVHNFNIDNLAEILDVDNFGTVSVTPGVEIEVPITKRWSLKPLAYGGWGAQVNGPQSAWIYWAGLKSRYRLGRGDLEWSLVNAIEYIGYTPNEGPSNDAVPVMAGLEFRLPLRNVKLGGDRVYLDWHATYTAYFDNLKFLVRDVPIDKVADTWELGLAFSKGKRKLKFWHFEWDRVGLAYQFSSSGKFQSVTLVFRSVFDS